MDVMREISGERLPCSQHGSMASLIAAETAKSSVAALNEIESLTDAEITIKVENILLERIKQGNKLAFFQLGQLYFEQGEYEKAKKYFESASEKGDYQATFQLGVILYDGLVGTADHKRGVEYMMEVANSSSPKVKHILHAAQFNIGRAYYQGYGLLHSDEEAEKWWLLAADDGNPKASVKAQTMLGMFYSREESQDLRKAFFWHSEACGNGSLESQGALGVMYLHGLGVKRDTDSAFICLRDAAERGSVYAMGNLVAYYYMRKLYTKTVELAARVAILQDVEQIAVETDCLPSFIAKGIAMACFYYARCLHQGLGVKACEDEAKTYYSKSYQFDADVCAQLQNVTTHGAI